MLSDEVAVACVTRWRPENVASGVTDLDVYDALETRQGARLLIHPTLHAKYYRADDRCLIGSANLTAQALGWAMPPNCELLEEVAASRPSLRSFEQSVFAVAIEADEAIRAAVEAAADALRAAGVRPVADEHGYATEGKPPPDGKTWLPHCPTPDRLYNVYADTDGWRLVASARAAAERDVASLQIRPVFRDTRLSGSSPPS